MPDLTVEQVSIALMGQAPDGRVLVQMDDGTFKPVVRVEITGDGVLLIVGEP